MKVGVFSCKEYEKELLSNRNVNNCLELTFLDCALTPQTVELAKPFDIVSVFVNDIVDSTVLDNLHEYGVFHVALRCVGFNNIDLQHAKKQGISVSRVLQYSAESVAEHTLALILTLNRKLFKAQQRALDNNRELEGLLGFNLSSKTIGIVGTGAIGSALVRIMSGFDCRILCTDPSPSKTLIADGYSYVSLDQLVTESDVISLHCPLTLESQHLINHSTIQNMKQNVMLINTSRGGLISMKAVINGLKSGKIGYLGIDIYEMESELSNSNIVCEKVPDTTFHRLSTFANVLITAHQGFFTQESLEQIADTTFKNLLYYFVGKVCNETYLV